MFLCVIFFKVLRGVLSLILSRLRTPIHSVASDSFNVAPLSYFVQLFILSRVSMSSMCAERCYMRTMGDEELGAVWLNKFGYI